MPTSRISKIGSRQRSLSSFLWRLISSMFETAHRIISIPAFCRGRLGPLSKSTRGFVGWEGVLVLEREGANAPPEIYEGNGKVKEEIHLWKIMTIIPPRSPS